MAYDDDATRIVLAAGGRTDAVAAAGVGGPVSSMTSAAPPHGLARAMPRALGCAVGLGCRVLTPILGTAAARAVPLAEPTPSLRRLCSQQGVLESAIVDERGRLFFTSQIRDGLRGAVLRMDAPDAPPVQLSARIPSPGGLAFDAGGLLIAGFGDSPMRGVIGNVLGTAGLLLIDPESGARETWVTGLGMANGIARAPDGSVFASNDCAMHVDRIDRHGRVHRRWARIPSANGLAVDLAGRYLYAAQTFVPAAIARVDIADPSRVLTYARPGAAAWAAAPDGLAIDDRGRLYVAANGAGAIWRVEPDGQIVALARGLACPSAVAIGRGPSGFSQGNLYAVTFGGDVVELGGAVPD